MMTVTINQIDIDGTPTKNGLKLEGVSPPGTAGVFETMDGLTHNEIIGANQILPVDLSALTLKSAASVGSYNDKTYKLNLTFKDTEGELVKFVISSPKAEIGGGADTIYLLAENGGTVPPTLPVGGTGFSGAELATKVELIKGYTPGDLTFLSGSLSKSPR